MKCLGLLCVTMLLGTLVSGCDWTSSGQDGGWSSQYENVNFSGVYRGRNGGSVLSGAGGFGEAERTVANELILTLGSQTSGFTATLSRTPVVAGTLRIFYEGDEQQSYEDNGNGRLVGDRGGSGTIEYGTGRVAIQSIVDGSPAILESGLRIYASYKYRESLPGGEPGKLMTLNVTHTGQHLDILTSTGVRFEGRLGGISSTGGENDQQRVTAEFSATASQDGRRIRMVGVFQTTLTQYFDVTVNEDGSMDRDIWGEQMSARVINATWTTEGSSSTLDIYAEAPSQEIRRTN